MKKDYGFLFEVSRLIVFNSSGSGLFNFKCLKGVNKQFQVFAFATNRYISGKIGLAQPVLMKNVHLDQYYIFRFK